MQPQNRTKHIREFLSQRLRLACDRERWQYLVSGITRRLTQKKSCPVCGDQNSSTVDNKLTFSLNRCSGCGLLYRYPYESQNELDTFYQSEYTQAGLTTDLPDDTSLQGYLDVGFANTEKDFSRVVSLLQALNLTAGHRVLDYGANWGYCTWQLRRAGYDAQAYELSRPRAAFGRKLGVEIHTSFDVLPEGFDASYSSHVLEHTADPKAAIEMQLAKVRGQGFVVAHTPNGSEERRRIDPTGFHLHWGRVHPVLLSAEFVAKSFPHLPWFVSSRIERTEIQSWLSGKSQSHGPLDGPELFLIIRKPDSVALGSSLAV